MISRYYIPTPTRAPRYNKIKKDFTFNFQVHFPQTTYNRAKPGRDFKYVLNIFWMVRSIKKKTKMIRMQYLFTLDNNFYQDCFCAFFLA